MANPGDPRLYASAGNAGACNCESSHCEHGREPWERCPNDCDGRTLMEFVGPICSPCVDVALANGGAHYLTPYDADGVTFVEVAPGELDAYRDDGLVATITTRQDGVRVLWDDSRGSDDGPQLRADPRRFADLAAARAAVSASR